MKFVLALFFVAVAMAMVAADDAEEWANFKKQHNKNYEGEEDQKRMKIFLDNKKKVEEHNAKYEKGEVSYKQGINAFSDETEEEHKQHHKGFGNTDHHEEHSHQH